MARARTIKPSFFDSEQVASCSVLARLTFTGLWCLADRDGKLQDRPRRIRAELFPYEADLDLDAALDDLSRAGLIVRYEVDGERFMQIPGFKKHQNPHPKESQSVIPDPCNYTASHGKVLSSRAGSSVSPLQDPPSPLAGGMPAAEPASPVVAVLPCVGDGRHDYAVTQVEIDAWRESFPALDLKAEVLRAKAWLEANPDSRKPHSRVPGFLVNWFGRSVDGGKGKGKPVAFAPAMHHTQDGEVEL